MSNTKRKSKQAEKVATLKADVSLFAQLYIVAQDRESDLSNFFSMKTTHDRGNLRFGNKSDLLKCLMQTQVVERPVSLEGDDDDLDLLANV